MGRHFDEFTVGDRYETPRRTIIDADIMQFAGLTADFNPLHTDDIFAAESDFGRRIAHGPMLIGMAFGLASRAGLLDGTALALLDVAWRFLGPVRPGDTVFAQIHVTETRPSRKPDRGVVAFRIDMMNQQRDVVQSGAAKILMKRRTAAA
ncbi:MAG: MaoC/PaaZ C-terminal domain-containing protein [Pseudomonadota bacterium]